MEKTTPTMMGHANKTNVLHLIKHAGPMSRADVAKALNMSRSTISSIADILLRDGRVCEGRTGDSTSAGGRRPVLLNYVSKAGFAVGIDIGATKTIVMVTDLDGNIIHREKFPSHVEGTSSIYHIRAECERILRESGVSTEDILGTAIGFPGVTAADDGIVMDAPGVHLHHFHAVEYFSGLPGPIYIDNDANMGVIGERWKGAAVGRDNVILVAVGTGIGAGFILNGQLFRGAKGFAGKGIQDFAMGSLDGGACSMRLGSNPSTEQIFAAAAAGDEFAESVVTQAISYLSFSIANMVTMLNPDVVILGGGVSRVGTPFLDEIRERVLRLSSLACEIVPASLGEDATAFGSAATVLMHAGELRLSGVDHWRSMVAGGTDG